MLITKEMLGIKIVEENGQFIVADFGQGVKSAYPTRLDAEAFVASLLAIHNPETLN